CLLPQLPTVKYRLAHAYSFHLFVHTFHFLSLLSFFLDGPRLPPNSTLFPYTTLFRSGKGVIKLESLSQQVELFLQLHVKVIKSRSEEHTSELQSRFDIVCRLLLEKKNFKSFTRKIAHNRTSHKKEKKKKIR